MFWRNQAQNLYKSQITQTIPSIGSSWNLNDEYEINVLVAPKYNSWWVFVDFANTTKRDLIYFHSRTGNVLKYYRKNRDLLWLWASTQTHDSWAYIQMHDVSEWINYLSNNTSDFGFAEWPYETPLTIKMYGGRINYWGPAITVADANILLPVSSTKEIIFDFADNTFKAIDTASLSSYACYHCGTAITWPSSITSYTEARQFFLWTSYSSTFFQVVSWILSLKDWSIPSTKLDASVQTALWQAHTHWNKTTVLDLFTTASGVLYFNGSQIVLNNQTVPILSISQNFIGPVYASLAALNAAFPSPSNWQQWFYCILEWVYYDCTGWVFLPRNNTGTTINAALLAWGKVALPSAANILAWDNTDVNGNPLVVQPWDLKAVKDALNTSISNISLHNSFVLWENLSINDPVFLVDDTWPKVYKYIWYLAAKANIWSWVSNSTAPTSEHNIKLLKTSATTFVAFYMNRQSAEDRVYGVEWTIASNNTITYWTPQAILSWGTFVWFDVCSIWTSKFALAWNISWDSFVRSIVCSISWGTWTVWTITAGSAISTAQTILTVCQVDTDKYAIFSLSNSARLWICSVSGTTITYWSVVVPSINLNAMEYVSNGKIVGTNWTNARIYTISGTVPTEQASFSMVNVYTSPSLTTYTPTAWYVIFSGTTWGNTEAFIMDCTGTTPTKWTTLVVKTWSVHTTNGLWFGTDVVIVSAWNIYSYLSVTGTTLEIKNVITITDTISWRKWYLYMGLKTQLWSNWLYNSQPGVWALNNNRANVLWSMLEAWTTAQTKKVSTPWLLSGAWSYKIWALYYIHNGTGVINTDSTTWPLFAKAISTTQYIIALAYSTL